MALKKPSSKTQSEETTATGPASNSEDTPKNDSAEINAVGPSTAEIVAQSEEAKSVMTTTSSSGANIPSVASGAHTVEGQLAEQGFEGMQVGFHSFITVSLPSDGIFETSEEEQIGKSFNAYLISSKPKWLYSAGKDDDDPTCYSYDQVRDTSGNLIADTLVKWEAEGYEDITVKQYTDVQADVESGELAGETVILSVAPASVQKLTGYLGKLSRKGKILQETLTEVYVMDKVKLKSGNSFYPWGFRLAQE